MIWRHRFREAPDRERLLPTHCFPGTLALLGVWVGVGAPNVFPGAGDLRVVAAAKEFALLCAILPNGGGAGPAEAVTSSFADAVEAARVAWSRQDAAAIIASSRSLMLQLPGAGTRASVGRDQAIRLIAGVLHRSEGVSVRVQAAREVGPGQGYAELVRQYRVTGTEEVRSHRILLAFREVPSLGRWELVELRVLQDGG